jgi:hypothetical protein
VAVRSIHLERQEPDRNVHVVYGVGVDPPKAEPNCTLL